MLYLFRPSITIIKENNAGRPSCERLPLRANVFVLFVLELITCVCFEIISSSSSIKLFSSLDNKHHSIQHFLPCFSTYICILEYVSEMIMFTRLCYSFSSLFNSNPYI